MLLLVASETGHVYTYATSKLQRLISDEEGNCILSQVSHYWSAKANIQACLEAPDSEPSDDDDDDEDGNGTGGTSTRSAGEVVYCLRA